MNDGEPCDACPAKPANGKGECCPCPKCSSDVTRYVARDSGRSWINKHADPKEKIPEAVIWRCLECGNVYTVDPGIKCCDEIEMEIRRSRGALLDLEDGWDSEGGRKILEGTIDRAGARMRSLVKAAKDLSSIDIGPAGMFPGHAGEVELLWKNDDFVLSIDVPEDENKKTVYAGNDHLGLVVKGNKPFDDAVSDIVHWLEKIVENSGKMTDWIPL